MSMLPKVRDYEILGKLAVGGMAEIYHARSLQGPLAGRQVVLKRLLPLFRTQRAYVEQFLEEARIGVQLVHPNVVHTYDLFREEKDFYLVQEFIPGSSLGSLRARGPLGFETELSLLLDLLDALEYLHEGGGLEPRVPVIHRDVTPDNLIVDPEGLSHLIDFGIAERQGSPGIARTGALRGTPAYMSPEQVKGRTLDIRSDLFSAGIILWESLASRPLFAHENEFETLRHVAEVGAPSLASVNPSVPSSFDALCLRALSPLVEERFSSAREMKEELLECCALDGISPSRQRLAAALSR